MAAAVAVYAATALLTHRYRIQDYYSSLESRLGYSLFLGNTRHCGFYWGRQAWPLKINQALRAIEEKLYDRLVLPPGSTVLDARAGSGHVAIHIARKELFVNAIDITPHYLKDAKKNVRANQLESRIKVEYGDYHNLEHKFPENHFDGIYTMKTFVHANDPATVLRNFFQLLKPGGTLVLHEAEFRRNSPRLQEVLRLSHCQNTLEEGNYKRLIEEAGFTDFSLKDLSDNVLKIVGQQQRFPNIMAGVEAWLHWEDGRYISVRAIKPLPTL
ncbi:S-adenosyl-L-methionine-dependent methyltransferase [Massariosphaeria phaeospora]|uniref:S-adenosyl-L-methionine-dependent methyltransferase n=1 Tax=Massariosphaeria phaeospora TaxID=100035 RepID=A0A7C8M3I3_9PLEO|nr:S-adenosyl-L-methionine-dependent methyltransferase [Massariosphaeria phaeospora]